MSQYKGFLLSFLITMIFVFPILLFLTIDNIYNNAFIKQTNEFSNIVQEEGGKTNRVDNLINEYEERGYNISLLDQEGRAISEENLPPGEVIQIQFEYEYFNTFSDQTRETVNNIVVDRR